MEQHWHRRSVVGAYAFALIALAPLARLAAFDTIGNGYGSKWGEDPSAGSGAVVTWGYMLDGTTIDPSVDVGVVSASNITQLRTLIDTNHGAGAFDAAIERAFETWSDVANIRFVGPLADDGMPVGAEGATSPNIRIGAFAADENHWFADSGATGFGPPGPSGADFFPLSGDILFNLARAAQISPFHIATGIEDVTPVDVFQYGDDLEGLFLHELGHAAIGLNHPRWNSAAAENPDQRVMYTGDWLTPGAPPCCQAINRQLHADDIAAAQYVYGLTGDYSRNGEVDAADYTSWRDSLGTTIASGSGADGNVDGSVDGSDYAEWQANFGRAALAGFGEQQSLFEASTVPEPTGWGLLCAATVSLGSVARADRGAKSKRLAACDKSPS